MYKAIIIDDEEMARTLLQGMIAEYCKNIEIVDLCRDLPTGVKSIHKHKPNIVFLDIEMPCHSGLELLDFFNDNEIDFSIIFVTAYNHYAINAFKLSAVDYLLKPIDVEDLKNAISLFEKDRMMNKEKYVALKENLEGNTKKIALNTLNSTSFVDINDILFFQGDGAYTKVYLKDAKIVTISKGLKNFENMLIDSPVFFRCHKSYIVNINHITDYIKTNGGSLIIDKKNEISISSDKIDVLMKKVGAYKCL